MCYNPHRLRGEIDFFLLLGGCVLLLNEAVYQEEDE
jgi:hypothetical protein